jgi:hypothetical protein
LREPRRNDAIVDREGGRFGETDGEAEAEQRRESARDTESERRDRPPELCDAVDESRAEAVDEVAAGQLAIA